MTYVYFHNYNWTNVIFEMCFINLHWEKLACETKHIFNLKWKEVFDIKFLFVDHHSKWNHDIICRIWEGRLACRLSSLKWTAQAPSRTFLTRRTISHMYDTNKPKKLKNENKIQLTKNFVRKMSKHEFSVGLGKWDWHVLRPACNGPHQHR